MSGSPTPDVPASGDALCPRCWEVFPVEGRFCPRCGQAQPGEGWATLPHRLLERYELLEPLSSGAMASTFRARDAKTDARIAIKLAHRGGSDEERASLRHLFQREQRASAILSESEHFIAITGLELDADPPYIKMELVPWPTLSDLLWDDAKDEPRTMPAVEAARIGVAILRGLEQLHALWIVHRDLKPSDLHVRQRQDGGYDVKIANLGMWAYDRQRPASPIGDGRASDEGGESRYRSPEQGREDPVDARADLHAVGAILWEAVTGDLPFGEDGERTQLPERPASMPAALYDILQKALALVVEKRWGSAQKMREALEAFVKVVDGERRRAEEERQRWLATTDGELRRLAERGADLDHRLGELGKRLASASEQYAKIAEAGATDAAQRGRLSAELLRLVEDVDSFDGARAVRAERRAPPPIPPDGGRAAPRPPAAPVGDLDDEQTMRFGEVDEKTLSLVEGSSPPARPIPWLWIGLALGALLIGSAVAGYFIGHASTPTVVAAPPAPTPAPPKPAAPAPAAPVEEPAQAVAQAEPAEGETREDRREAARPRKADAAVAPAKKGDVPEGWKDVDFQARAKRDEKKPKEAKASKAKEAAERTPPLPTVTVRASSSSSPPPPAAAREEKPAPRDVARAADLPQFLSRDEIRRGMASIQDQVHRCYEQFHVGGQIIAKVVILNAGRVKSVEVQGPLADSPTGDCVVRAATAGRFNRFAGEPMTITYPFQLR